MRLYHFVPANFGLQDVGLRRLKVARLTDLNDPFEFQGIARRESLDQLVWDMSLPLLNDAFGILCFSDRWSNPVQWSHYADRHRGLCLGFDVPDSLVQAVKYVRKPLTADLLGEISKAKLKGEDAAMRVLLATKYSHWRYEHEHRVIVRLAKPEADGLHFVHFDDALRLCEVIFGPRCQLTPAHVEDALGDDLVGDVQITQAGLARASFRVVRQRGARTERSSRAYAETLIKLLGKHDGRLE